MAPILPPSGVSGWSMNDACGKAWVSFSRSFSSSAQCALLEELYTHGVLSDEGHVFHCLECS